MKNARFAIHFTLFACLITLGGCLIDPEINKNTTRLPKADELAQLHKGRYLQGEVRFSHDDRSSLHANIYQNGKLEHELVLQRESIKNEPTRDIKNAEILFIRKAAVIKDLHSGQQYALMLSGEEGEKLLESLPSAYRNTEKVEGYGLAIYGNMKKLYGSL